MTSSYPHFASGGSLPNDYAIVSHFASTYDETAIDSDTEDALDDGEHAFAPGTSPRRVLRQPSSREFARRNTGGYGGISPVRGRRLSAPHHQHNGGPRRLSRGAAQSKSPAGWATERDGLLSPTGALPTPVESDDDDASVYQPEDEPGSWAMWVQEAKILAKYTAPVSG